ncbi:MULTISPECIES: hypothetical protein [Propionibacteriaceae]|uniref:hypothetical protein n=1 Tax=Propionibacteriaceae TaxID=31957 RepID=UPI0012D992C3|nr:MULTISPECIES: hypothetical protein [Propionibacteriaceae]MDN5996518.1 hypothetical protein [Acidipropionibacterium jensenii]
MSTPLVTAANWGLRNGYITLPHVSYFADYVVARILGVLVAALGIYLFGAIINLDPWMTLAVIMLKSADSMTDIWYARWQRQQRLVPFGSMMILNGVVTVGCAMVFYFLHFSAAGIVFGSSVGSVMAFASSLAIDAGKSIHWIKRWRSWLPGLRTRLRIILVACWQICAAQVLAGLVVNVPTWAVAAFGSSADVGRFAAAAYMITVGSLVGASMNSTVLGQYHSDMVTGGATVVQRRVERGTRLITGLGLCAVVAVWFAGVPLFRLLYGAEFTFQPMELLLVALAAILNPGTFLMNAALLAVNLYGDQLSIVAMALAVSAAVAGVAVLCGVPGFLVGALSALAGSLAKYGLSAWRLRLVRGVQPGT